MEVVLFERGVVYSKVVLPKSSVVVPCVDDIVKILLCEGRDVELGARTLKHIFVFAFDPLSLTLSLSLSLSYILHCIILFILYMLDIVCVSYLC